MDKYKTCQICNITFSQLGTHLKYKHNLTQQEYYDIYIKENEQEGFCFVCKKETKFRSLTKGYCKYCSYECKEIGRHQRRDQTNLEKYGSKSPAHNSAVIQKMKQTKFERYGDSGYNNIEKIKQTNLEKYNCTNVFQDAHVKEKAKQTNLEKYGVEYYLASDDYLEKTTQKSQERYNCDWPSQSEEIKEKVKQTVLENYGVEYYLASDDYLEKTTQKSQERYNCDWPSQSEEIKEKVKQTVLENYGVEYYFQTEDAKVKTGKTLLEKYGVKNAAQIPDKNIKSMYQWHNYTLPSGKETKLQGYEPQALDLLLESFTEDEILYRNKDMPEIWYYNDSDEKWHRYFPDFYISKENLIIEVKSDYTFEADYNINILKKEACEYLGYNFKFKIM